MLKAIIYILYSFFFLKKKNIIGHITRKFTGIYSATKAALEAITDALRQEVSDFDISVSLVDPAYVGTEIGQKGIKIAQETFATLSNNNKQLYNINETAIINKRIKTFANAPTAKDTTNIGFFFLKKLLLLYIIIITNIIYY